MLLPFMLPPFRKYLNVRFYNFPLENACFQKFLETNLFYMKKKDL